MRCVPLGCFTFSGTPKPNATIAAQLGKQLKAPSARGDERGVHRPRRKLRENPLWRERRRFSKVEAWIDLLLDANWQDGETLAGGKRIPVRRGQVVFSQRRKAAEWGWARGTVHAFLADLEKSGSVSHPFEPPLRRGFDGGFTLLTICKWDEYQGKDSTQEGEGAAPALSHLVEPPLSHPFEPPPAPRIEPPQNPDSTSRTEDQQAPELSHPQAPELSHPFEHIQEVRKEENLAGDKAPAGASKGNQRGNGKARPRENAIPDPNPDKIIRAHTDIYRETFGTVPPVAWARARVIAKNILRGRTVEEAQWLVREHVMNPPAFYAEKNLYGLEHVLKAAPILLARRAKAREYDR